MQVLDAVDPVPNTDGGVGRVAVDRYATPCPTLCGYPCPMFLFLSLSFRPRGGAFPISLWAFSDGVGVMGPKNPA